MTDHLARAALEYHSAEPKGKSQVQPKKPMAIQQDLALAYWPGVAITCEEIAANPLKAQDYTMSGHLVAVISCPTTPSAASASALCFRPI